MVCGAPCSTRLAVGEAQRLPIHLIDKDINNSHRVVLANVIVQAFGQQYALAWVHAFDKSLHRPPRLNGLAHFIWDSATREGFSHSLDRIQTCQDSAMRGQRLYRQLKTHGMDNLEQRVGTGCSLS